MLFKKVIDSQLFQAFNNFLSFNRHWNRAAYFRIIEVHPGLRGYPGVIDDRHVVEDNHHGIGDAHHGTIDDQRKVVKLHREKAQNM